MAGEFRTHRLNEAGIKKCDAIGEVFENTLAVLQAMCANQYKGTGAREMALVATKLQEACFFAKRAVAILPEYQESAWTCRGCGAGRTTQPTQCACGFIP